MKTTTESVRVAVEIAVSLLLIFFIIAWCFQIIQPFIAFIMWGAVIAISLYKPFCGLRERMGPKAAVALFALSGLALVLIPAWLFAGSVFESVTKFASAVQAGSFDIPPPSDAVKEWPLVGDKAHAAWTSAATNFEQFLTTYSEQMKGLASFALNKVAGIGITVLAFVLATLIATAMLANDKIMAAGFQRLTSRLVGKEKADETLTLVVATIRSVTMGVLGVAFIQGVLGGIGMVVAGVPGAGIWAVAIMVLAIAQLPPLLILLPAIIYVFSQDAGAMAYVFTIWSIGVSFSDAILKPLLLGRGVEVPMLVILLGAIGGMLMSGILGLFVGAVVLALGYKLFMAWLESGEDASPDAEAATEESAA